MPWRFKAIRSVPNGKSNQDIEEPFETVVQQNTAVDADILTHQSNRSQRPKPASQKECVGVVKPIHLLNVFGAMTLTARQYHHQSMRRGHPEVPVDGARLS